VYATNLLFQIAIFVPMVVIKQQVRSYKQLEYMTNVWCDVNDALLFLVTEIKTPHGILYKIYTMALVMFILGVYPHRASLKNMPGHGGNRTYDLWNTSPMVRSVRVCDISDAVAIPPIRTGTVRRV
jgi:hypothetical protein